MICENSDIYNKYVDINSFLSPSNNDVSLSTGFEAINNSINNILTIRRFEIPSQPQEFVDLYMYLHEIADEITFEALRTEVKNALTRYETRIDTLEIQIEEFVTDNYIVLTVVYKLKEDTNNNLQTTTVTLRG